VGLKFMSWVRAGLAAKIGGQPWSGQETVFQPRAGVPVNVTLNTAGSRSVSVVLNGPGDVAGIDPAQIIRMEPADGAKGAEPNFFPMVEFERADLPWLFSPLAPAAAPSGGARGLPGWVCLIVLQNPRQYPFTPAGMTRPLPSIHAPAAELPDLGQIWLWAHGQALTGAAPGVPLGDLLKDPGGSHLSRLLAPRRLQPNSEYLACVVPVFEAGRRAGLGLEAGGAAGYAWSGAEQSVELPVYASWSFSTGEAGDFQYLASKLFAVAESDAGVCELDISAEAGLLGLSAASGGYAVNLEGALVSASLACGSWPDQRRQAAFFSGMAQKLTPRPGVMTPPVYGSAYANYTGPQSVLSAAKWLSELNLDPRYRVAAALGAQVIRKNQEELMASAWQQAARAREVNAALGKAQLALVSGRRIYDKRVGPAGTRAPLSDSQLMAFCAPVRGQFGAAVLGKDGASAMAALAGGKLARAVYSQACRKLLRPAGRLARRVADNIIQIRPYSAASAAQPAAVSFDDFVSAQLFENPAPVMHVMSKSAPAAALCDESLMGYLSDLLVFYKDQILHGLSVGFDGAMRFGWRGGIHIAPMDEIPAALAFPETSPNDYWNIITKNYDSESRITFTKFFWNECYLTLPGVGKVSFEGTLPYSSDKTTAEFIKLYTETRVSKAVAHTCAFDQNRPGGGTMVLARFTEDAPMSVETHADLSWCTVSKKTMDFYNTTSMFSADKVVIGQSSTLNGITVTPYFGAQNGASETGGQYWYDLNVFKHDIKKLAFTIDKTIEGDDGAYIPAIFSTWPNPWDYHLRAYYEYICNTVTVTFDRQYAFEYCLLPGYLFGAEEAATDGKTVWHKIGDSDNLDFGDNISDVNIAFTKRNNQWNLIATWRADCSRPCGSNSETNFSPHGLYMIVGADINQDGKAACWSKIQRLGGFDKGLPCSVTALGDQVFVLSGGELSIFRLDSGGRAWDRFTNYSLLLPAGYMGGAIAALDLGPGGGVDLLFACVTRLSHKVAAASYRIAYGVDQRACPASWGGAFHLPLKDLPTDSADRPRLRLFLGSMSAKPAAARAQFKTEFARAANDLIKGLAGPPAAAMYIAAGPLRPPAPPLTAELAASAASAVRGALDPQNTVRSRAMKKLALPPAVEKAVSARLSPLVIAPKFSLPAAELLIDLREDSFFIGASRVKDNTVTVLAPNNRFIEAFMTGLNHEMARELLWRDFPADFRATYFDTFWDRSCGGVDAPDIKPIAEWGAAAALGANTAAGGVGLLLCIRGDLIRRMPGVMLYAAPAVKNPDGTRSIGAGGRKEYPLFSGHLSGGTVYFAFNLTAADARGDTGEGWFFVFQENPTAPRFGLNEAAEGEAPDAGNISAWEQLNWGMAGLKNGYIDALGAADLNGRALPAAPGGVNTRRWGYSAADMAHITLQRPVQVAIHGSKLIRGEI